MTKRHAGVGLAAIRIGAAPVAIRAGAAFAVAAIALFGSDARGMSVSDTSRVSVAVSRDTSDRVVLEAHGLLQMWWTAAEDVENGLRQAVTGDEAVDVASGFSMQRARVHLRVQRGAVSAQVSVRLEGSPPGLLDAFATVPISGTRLAFSAGQFKIPSTYEAARSPGDLDFASRGLFSSLVADYSLSRSPSLASPRFYGVRTYFRDAGLGLAGRLGAGRFALMIGNGLGANRFAGGREAKGEVVANEFGAYFYGLRVDVGPESGGSLTDLRGSSFQAGGHVNWNRHPDVLLDDERTVADLDRRSWSVDARGAIAGRARVTALYGEGVVDDDIDADGVTDYRYRGWEAAIVVPIIAQRLELGLRHDAYAEEFSENGAEDILRGTTLGASWAPAPGCKLQANYKWKSLDSSSEPDLDDDVLVFVAQFAF